MKNLIKIVFILSLCFLGKAQAQEIQWTSEQTNKAQQEVELVNDVVTLTANQKVLLTDVFLNKNQMLERGVRVEWGKKIVLSSVEDILRYGMQINRHPGQENIHQATEIMTKELYTEKILNNELLLEELNLIITEE